MKALIKVALVILLLGAVIQLSCKKDNIPPHKMCFVNKNYPNPVLVHCEGSALTVDSVLTISDQEGTIRKWGKPYQAFRYVVGTGFEDVPYQTGTVKSVNILER